MLHGFLKAEKKSEIDITSYSKAQPGNWIWENIENYVIITIRNEKFSKLGK